MDLLHLVIASLLITAAVRAGSREKAISIGSRLLDQERKRQLRDIIDSIRRYLWRQKMWIISLLFFFAHLHLGWRFSDPHISLNTANVVLYPLKELVQAESLAFWRYQMNFYTGTPFFLLPIFKLVDIGPALFRLLLLSFMAASTLLAVATYTTIFNLRRGVIGGIILLFLPHWITFHQAAYTYGVLFSGVILFLFVRWHHDGGQRLFYWISFLTGFLAYFKALLVYTVLGLFTGMIVTYPQMIVRRLRWRQLLVGGVLFLLGLTPFLLFIDNSGLSSAGILGMIADSGGRTAGSVAQMRACQLTQIITPGAHIWDGHPCNALFSPITAILLISVLYAVYRPRTRIYGVAAIVMFLLQLITPSTPRWPHLLVLIPLLTIAVLSLYERLPRHQKMAEYFSIGVLLVGFLFFIPVYHSFDGFTSEPWKWTAGAEAWTDYQELERDDPLVTTSPWLWTLTLYDLDTEGYLLVPPDSSRFPDYVDEGFSAQSEFTFVFWPWIRTLPLSSKSGGRYGFTLTPSPLGYGQRELLVLDVAAADRPEITYVLDDGECYAELVCRLTGRRCNELTSTCGYTTQQVVAALNLSRRNHTSRMIGGKQFTVIR